MHENLTVSPAPHISKAHSTQSVMLDVLIGLAPAVIAAIIYFRIEAAAVIITCTIACIAAEWISNKMLRRPSSIGDLSAVVTAVILALSLPPTIPLWGAAVGSAFGIFIAKMVFGGLGANVFNPAMAARAFMAASLGGLMTTWTVPATVDAQLATNEPAAMAKISAANEVAEDGTTEAITQATPLAWSKNAQKGEVDASIVNKLIEATFTGTTGGCLGETSSLALILGGIYLLIKRTISFHIPAAVLLSAFAAAAIGWFAAPEQYANPVFHITSGGMLICAFFIATDPVTAPLTKLGMWIFGIGVGVVIMLIRLVGEYPEGVMYAVLLMNAFTPLIDRFCKLTPAGGKANA
ncbi:Nitrogen fixation protein RnfD [Anaerohalosphaera lusitana]|uniref:Ion-translocating oxidoreductase complex subunit D n=1 Tax=Anaerohalosphaera lusitana TaxID=1936003 RepID=A0A1U9NIF2_9BACT|nr:RnfABCDGE type electron transport complex subunit D [Anaerohalosphaera lusitana]AQT67360.1 Nitrogen fixation protein RnfD [Anaerohalosphaera lusitana]